MSSVQMWPNHGVMRNWCCGRNTRICRRLVFQTGQSAEIGRELLEDRNGVITEYGLIRRLDGQPVQSLHEAPEQNGMEMI